MLEHTSTKIQRVIGLDAHPDTFTAAVLQGQTPAQAVVEKVFNKVPMSQLESWARKHTTAEDLLVLEASGNSFQVVRALAVIDRRALVLESCHLGKLKEAHANNDRISAVRIAKAYLAGTAKKVWVPDAKTQERRDCFHAHRKAVNQTTRARNRLLSYLSNNGVRLKKGTRLTQNSQAGEALRQARQWSACQWQLIEGLLLELEHAEQRRKYWRSVIAQEVTQDPLLLSLVRLCGIKEQIAFAIGALIGNVDRFARPGSLVKYIGLNPAFDDSGQGRWSGGIGGHGRKDLRALLIQGAQAILRSRDPLAVWGKKLIARKGSFKLAVAAVARRLAVAIWYLLKGQWTTLEEVDRSLKNKVTTIITRMGAEGLKRIGQTRENLVEQIHQSLKSGRTYVLDPKKKFVPKPKSNSLAAEYGVS